MVLASYPNNVLVFTENELGYMNWEWNIIISFLAWLSGSSTDN